MNDPLATYTITVYNRYSVSLPPFPPSTRFDRTVIKGVMWKDVINTNANSNGKSMIDQTISIKIPLEAEIEGGKTYITPSEYERLPVDNLNHWTLRMGDTDSDTIALGETPELTALYGITQLKRDYKTMDIRSVSDSTNQDILPQWKIGGV